MGDQVRVVVVDDDDINRRGMASALRERPEIELVAALTHGEAMAWPGAWGDVDVVVVDAADERAPIDQFPGVAVVERVRQHTSSGRTSVVVVTGHFFDDAVRRRIREARADFLYHRSELADARVLHEAVLHPETCRRVPATNRFDLELLQGVSSQTRVNRAVEYAVRQGLEALLAERPAPRSRAWLRLRREFNRVARLTPITTDGLSPARAQQLPSRPQISRFLAWATKVKGNQSSPS